LELESKLFQLTRLFDFFFSLLGLVLLAPILLVVTVIGFKDFKRPIFTQLRVGRGQRLFVLFKFRTMQEGTASVATHLADKNSITPWGRFLRKSKIDELPQLINVLKGEMSLVGPRPCLPEQSELVERRAQAGLFAVRPGITGLAQVRKVDMSNPEALVALEAEMLRTFSLGRYFAYILMTVLGAGGGDRVR
jgi:O-antigen biosynthesis protein WbqP